MREDIPIYFILANETTQYKFVHFDWRILFAEVAGESWNNTYKGRFSTVYVALQAHVRADQEKKKSAKVTYPGGESCIVC